ncbi:MAG: hypothetical protein ALECFALPRED_000495 [Alectoria fallacina]|uniref:BHLH domain-containing protein n=1 Tax=Alectoria fallacina TaxID=1903189 RepID=A0A8H3J9S6_9LECA|nr:MAG: hypothetical protein ALECFALPRED_000495 [Alectoria fallacina]
MDRIGGVKGGTPYAAPSSPDKDWDHWMDWDPVSRSDRASTASMPLSIDGHDLQRSSIETNESRNLTPISKENDPSTRPAKKRKASTESVDSATPLGSQDGKSTFVQNKSHSIVEKRYRTNLNDKIADLRKSIPSLRGDASNLAETERLSATPKHNKSTILTKAVEYIHHLERRNAYLENVNAGLRSQARNAKSEVVQDGDTVRAKSSKSPYAGLEDSPSTTQDSPITPNAPHGMIPVPDDIRKLRNTAPQEHYADRISSEDQQPGAHFSIKGGKIVGKLMVGSLAGLMVMDGFMGNRKDRENDRGLFALPFSAAFPTLTTLWTLQGRFASFPYAVLLLPMIKGFLVFSILGLILFLYLFNSKPKLGLKHATEGKRGSRSSASPIEVRENAWLTAIQTLKVPRHSWFPEMMALILETGAYIIRQLLGWDIYSWLMGRSEEEEIARVRAWEIAIDAQLTGGDAEVSRSRLVLTVWAAGTLPKTPARLMLKALHLRIMFWQASRWPRVCWAFNLAASRLAQYQWTLANRMLDVVDVVIRSGNVEPLSDHLLALLQRPAEEVMTDLTIQQAHNLCWNRSVSTTSEDVGVDDIAEDTAMRGPLDALSLWSSSLVLQEALRNFLEIGETTQTQLSQIETALRTAPPGSSSSIRALAAKTIFSEADRTQNINKLLEALPSSSAVSFPGSLSEISPFPSTVCNDVLTSVECAKALDALTGPQPDLVSLGNAVQLLDRTCSGVKSLDVLALAAAYILVLALINDPSISGQYLCSLNQIILNMVVKLDEPDNKIRTRAQNRFKTALRKLRVQRRSSDASVESGYVSM